MPDKFVCDFCTYCYLTLDGVVNQAEDEFIAYRIIDRVDRKDQKIVKTTLCLIDGRPWALRSVSTGALSFQIQANRA